MAPGDLDSVVVLVTGAAGFLGARLTQTLTRRGAQVHGVIRRSRPTHAGHRWWRVDLSDLDAVRRLMGGVRPDVIFHLAAHVSGERAADAVPTTLRDNLVTSVNVLTAANELNSPKVLLAGSMEELGDGSSAPVSPYAVAKSSASSYGRMFHALYGLPVVNLTTFMVYGPGQRDRSKLIPYAINRLLRDEPPRIATPDRLIDWVHVNDVVDAYIASAFSPAAVGRSVQVGSGELVSIRSVVDELVRITGSSARPEFGDVPARGREVTACADIRATSELIDWQPSVPLHEGLRETVEATLRARYSGSAPPAGPVFARGG